MIVLDIEEVDLPAVVSALRRCAEVTEHCGRPSDKTPARIVRDVIQQFEQGQAMKQTVEIHTCDMCKETIVHGFRVNGNFQTMFQIKEDGKLEYAHSKSGILPGEYCLDCFKGRVQALDEQLTGNVYRSDV